MSANAGLNLSWNAKMQDVMHLSQSKASYYQYIGGFNSNDNNNK